MTTAELVAEVRAAVLAAAHNNSIDLRISMTGTEPVTKIQALARLYDAAPGWLAELADRLSTADDGLRYGEKVCAELVARAEAAESKLVDLEAVPPDSRVRMERDIALDRAEAAEREVRRLKAAVVGSDSLRRERATVGPVPCAAIASSGHLQESTGKSDDIDLDLLRKMATEAGGRRTGALRRAGYLDWHVTEAGHKALEEKP